MELYNTLSRILIEGCLSVDCSPHAMLYITDLVYQIYTVVQNLQSSLSSYTCNSFAIEEAVLPASRVRKDAGVGWAHCINM